MIKAKKQQRKKGSPAWMATFSDLMTLILVFFILLFSFSEIDATKFRMIAYSFKGLIDESYSMVPMEYPLSSPILNDNPTGVSKDKQEGKDQENNQAKSENDELDDLLQRIKSYLHEHDLEGVIIATREERGVELVLQESVLFDSGQAVVKQQAKPFLGKVADLIETLPNTVEVEGHTDSHRIIQPSMYTSNWNLSGDRSANVVNYFVKEHNIPADRFRISGYADTKPIGDNSTTEGRLKNRRVVIVILDNEPDD